MTLRLALGSMLALAACGGSPNAPDGSSAGRNDASVHAGTSVDAASPIDDGGTAAPTDAASPPDGSFVAGAVRFVGRVDTSNTAGPTFAWSNSGLVATVSGAKISVKLKSENSAAFFQPLVDGKPGMRFSVASGATDTVVLGSGLSSGNHTVELYRDTEGLYGDSVFLGFVEGTLVGAPTSNGRLIEIIGDSISAGYGNLGVETHPPYDDTCGFTLDTQAGYQSYAGILGRALDAEVSVIARSGWGVYRDGANNTSNVLQAVYANTVGVEPSPTWSFARKPDAVLINLGTNDSAMGDPGTPYETAFVAFLKTIRGHYPNARIFLTMGPLTSDPLLTAMQTHIDNVVKAFGDAKTQAIRITPQDASSTGCDYHPNVAEDQKMSDQLAPVMKTALGW